MENTKLSIGIVIALVMQISGFVWWIAQQAQTIEDLEKKVSGLTAKEAVSDEVNVKRDIQDLEKEIEYLWEAIDELDEDINEASEELREDLIERFKKTESTLKNHDSWIGENYADIENLIEFAEFTENKWADAYDSDPGYERIFGTR